MKNITLTVLSLSMIGQGAVAGIPSFEKDTRGKITQLLSHEPEVMNPFEAQKQGLDHAQTRFQPWSGSFWPDITGNITDHYRKHTTINSQLTYLFNYGTGKRQFTHDHQKVLENYETWSEDDLNRFTSPAEKYDIVMGDKNFTLTTSIMEEIDFRVYHRLKSVDSQGNRVDQSSVYGGDGAVFSSELEDAIANKNPTIFKWVNEGNNIALWSGICDGWAPASLYLPRPEKAVTLFSPTGRKVIFFPEDIKALGSYLFARTNTPYLATMNYQFEGQRCAAGHKPFRDHHDGYVNDMRCNDLDAGVWHATLINRIGKDRMGFVMDADNNIKVNNHPVHSYELTYFNPSNGKEGSLRESVVKKGALRFDGYAARRNPKTVYLVGVKSKVEFMYYDWAESHRNTTTDSPSEDHKKSTEYTYDLELDANYNIVGGEWGDRSKDRPILRKVVYADQPDFLWMAAPSALPYSTMSHYVVAGDKIDPKQPRPFGNMNWAYDGKKLPDDWIRAAKKDAEWAAPVVDDGTNTPDAVGSVLKSAQPLSPFVYYLFDHSRAPDQN